MCCARAGRGGGRNFLKKTQVTEDRKEVASTLGFGLYRLRGTTEGGGKGR